jgi:hypothetical protein
LTDGADLVSAKKVLTEIRNFEQVAFRDKDVSARQIAMAYVAFSINGIVTG